MEENVMIRSQTYREPIIPEIDSFYEFHTTELEPVEGEEDELNHQTEDNEIVFTINHGQDNGTKSNSHQATRMEPSLPNSMSKRQFMRRRSISLTNVDPGVEGGSGDGNGNSDSSSILQLRGAATFENLLEKGEECDILGRVPLRKSKNFSQTSLSRMRRSGSSSLDLDDEAGFKGGRPNSVLVHDNEELLKLAEELEIMNMMGHDIQDILDQCPKSPSPQRKLSSHCGEPSSRTTLVRRNSSGYHSGGSGIFAKCGQTNTKEEVQSHPNPEGPRQMIQAPQANLKSTPSPKIAHRSSMFEDSSKQTNTNSQSSVENHSKSSRLSSISSLFGASKRSSMQGSGHNPSKSVRKYDRQSSSSGRSGNKITGKSSQTGEEPNSSDDKRSNFIQSRSSTALQLLSSRRKSLAVTDNDAYAAMRSAKSQTDLTKSTAKPSPLVVPKKASGPGITDLKEAKTPRVKRSSFLSPNSDFKTRLSFKERSWTEIERLWKGKVKEPPNIEHVFITNEKARAKNRSERSKTIPLRSTLPTKTSPALARVASHHGSPGVYRVCPSSPQSRSTATLSPRAVNKSVDLLSPQIMEAWQISQGHLSERHQRHPSMPFLSGMSKSPSIESTPEMDAHFENLLLVWDAAAASSSPKAGNRVDRSQSLRDQEAVSRGQKRGTPGRERRKNSDPNLPRGGTRQSDVEVEIPPHQQTTSSGSSTSSLSASRSSVDSPAGSQEMVTAASASAVPSSSTPISSHSQAFRSPGPQSLEHHYHTIDGDDFEAPDSDYEPSTEDWRKALAKEDLDRLGKKESQRQDVLNELFNTERSHVRNLKVLDRLFYRPLVAESAHSLGQHKEFVESLFPNLPDVLAWHTKCNQKMKDKVKRLGYPVGNIGDILSEMFFGDNGDKLIEIGSTFTKNQKFTIEELKDRRKRDQRFDKFLTETENKPECRRLQLQALLPMEHQRLVKYPLLLNQLWKKGSEICDKTEQDIVHSCQERTCVILENIDRRVAEAQNMHMMAEIQKNLDTSGLDKLPDSPLYKEFRKVDLTQHTLLYDGVLTMKLGQKPKTKTVDLHVLLLEDCVMLLQKQDDKYLLKYHMTNSLAMTAANQSNMGKTCFAPIIKVSNLLIRPNATDKRSFYLLNNSPNGPQFYELATQSSTDRAQWFKHITEATNAFNSRDESQRASDRSGSDLSSQNGPLDGSSQAGAANDLVGGPGYEGGKASGRSESFKSAKHESDRDSNEDSVSKKTGDGNVNQSNDPANSSSSGQRKRLQRVEILKIAEPCPLIDPSQVVVTQGEIFMAEPILTPIEKLRRKDLEVARALEEKKQLLAEILNVPTEHFDDIADIASSQPSHDKDAREVLLAALAQAKSLCDLVNQILNMNDEDRMVLGSEVSLNSSYTRNTSSSSSSTREQQRPLSPTSGISGDVSTAGSGPSSLMSSKLSSSNSTTRQLHPLTGRSAGKLVSISVNLNSQLTTLLGKIQELDEERERMKRELQRSQEQVHAYLSQSTSVRTSSMSAVSPGSRPASFISVEESSGAGDLSEKGTQESGGEDDALPTNMYENISSSDQDLPEPVTPTNAKPLEEPPASSSDDSPSSPGPYTSLNKEESLENSPSDSDKTVTESTPTYNEEAPPSNETAPGPDETEDLDLAGANATASPVQETEE
ncbi:uncharacterized protein LOC131884098 isoform X9 [Tigriopus californicus]|nr:uncharacterized protein LOC131884098 isoform X9 [Tigriopus californicus]